MEIDDAIEFIVDFIRNPRPLSGYSAGSYDITLQIILIFYLREFENCPEYVQQPQDFPGGREISSVFYEAAWELCRRGVLRPSVRSLGLQGSTDGSGYSITAVGRRWVERDESPLLLGGPDRISKLFEKLSNRFGSGFLERASEATHCHYFHQYVACCAMCGAAAESILLAVAVAKQGNEEAVLRAYRAASGRQKITDLIIGGARQTIKEHFKTGTSLLSFWRDEAAHGQASTISEIEAHEALGRLIRFAQFVTGNWDELTKH